MTDILTRLHNLPSSRFHYKLLVLVGIGWLFDVMDTGLVPFVLPVLGKDWVSAPAQSGRIVSIVFVGMVLDAVFSGWLADGFGRKIVFAGMMVVYNIATGSCALVPDLIVLLVCRFFVGVGLGGQLPVVVLLVNEYAPPKVRGRSIVLLESFWGLGWLSAVLVSYFSIPQTGWHGAFLSGALPLSYVSSVSKFVPESVPYLLSRGKTNEAHHLVSALEIQSGIMPPTETVAAPAALHERIRFFQLWQHPSARRTLMLRLVWFDTVFSYCGIFIWLPELLVEQSDTVVKTFEYVLVMIAAQLPGYIAAVALVERIGRKATLAGFLAACVACVWLFGQNTTAAGVVVWGSLMSFFNLGAWGVLYTYTPELYPLRFRAFAPGRAGVTDRVGGIFAPMVVAAMVGSSGGFGSIFMMFALVMPLTVAIILVSGEETKGRTLEDVNQ